MKIILEKDSDLKSLETKVNEQLERLDYEGSAIKGVTYSAVNIPTFRGDKVIGNKVEYSVAVAYTPFMGV